MKSILNQSFTIDEVPAARYGKRHMVTYRVLFTFRDKISGKRFLAEVVMEGRLLVVNEGDGWWMYGVEPGGLAEGGSTPADALLGLRQSYREVLFDFAAEANTSFKAFKARVERFFSEKCEALEPEWQNAVAEIRKGTITPEGLEVRSKPIETKPADSKRGVKVRLLRIGEISPRDNQLDLPLAVAA